MTEELNIQTPSVSGAFWDPSWPIPTPKRKPLSLRIKQKIDNLRYSLANWIYPYGDHYDY